MHAIEWPDGYLPGFCDNFCSNEAIVAGLAAATVWPWLAEAERWPGYYANAFDILVRDRAASALTLGARFFFRTFGFPVEAEVVEHTVPTATGPGRLAWHGWSGDGDERLDVHHAWLIEDLPGGRVRILTQETQNGAPARVLATTRPDPMVNGHQAWLDGLIAAARSGRPATGAGR